MVSREREQERSAHAEHRECTHACLPFVFCLLYMYMYISRDILCRVMTLRYSPPTVLAWFLGTREACLACWPATESGQTGLRREMLVALHCGAATRSSDVKKIIKRCSCKVLPESKFLNLNSSYQISQNSISPQQLYTTSICLHTFNICSALKYPSP